MCWLWGPWGAEPGSGMGKVTLPVHVPIPCPFHAHSLPGHGIPEGPPPPRIPATAKLISEIKLKTL